MGCPLHGLQSLIIRDGLALFKGMIEIFTQNAELASKRSELLTQRQKAKELNEKIESDIEELEAKIEEVERIRLGEFFGIPKEEMFKEVRQHGRREIIGYHQLTSIHCKKLIDNEGGGTGYAFSTTRSGFCDTADGKISIYSGSRPKKGTYSYKGVYVELGIWQAPNGLWFGDCCGVHAKDSGHGLGSVAIDDVSVAFQTQKEVLDYCCRRAIERLTYRRIDEDPEEIEERCPDCTAWAQKHLQLTLEEGGTPEMWSPDKDYPHIHDHEVIGCTETEYCPTCDHERPDNPWFGSTENTITRMETSEETAKRVAEQRERPIFGKQQPDADKLIAKLEAMLGIASPTSKKKVDADQLELAL